MTAVPAAVPTPRSARAGTFSAAFAAAAVTIPHAVGLGLIAYAPLAGSLSAPALALWSAAIPGALTAIAALRGGRPAVVYAPTTVVALLFAAVLATLASTAAEFGMSGRQVLAAGGATVALAFAFQWLFGVLRLASLARFLPISVMHGFAAGVGLSMLVGQVRAGFGAGAWSWSGTVFLHALAAGAVVVVAQWSTRRWPRLPGLLPGVAAAAALVWLSGAGGTFVAAAPASPFALPPLPEFGGLPWGAVLARHGSHLVSLALLMAVVNSLDVLVFTQELALQHGVRANANAGLRQESLVGVLCGLGGLIPASTSASRTRVALAQAGPQAPAGLAHAAIMLAVAVTGAWWLHWVPMAALSGALVVAAWNQVPRAMLSRDYARAAPSTWAQAWIVALLFPIAGGAGALVAGLVVATFVLLHASASSALRRAHLDGQVRSRRLRRAASESWVAARMNRVAVIELQGVMSFGVAAHMAEQTQALLAERHGRVILDVQRVAAWDQTALVQLEALARDLRQQGRELAVCGLDARSRTQLPGVLQFPDLDRGLEWAEDALLEERPAAERPAYPADDLLGELGEGLDAPARRALEAVFQRTEVAPGEPVFLAGEALRDLHIVQSGLISMSTAWPPAGGLRLATVGQGMAFGEMAFLNGQPRTACAGSEGGAVVVARLSREGFDRWAAEHPAAALVFLSNLALIGTRRLAATTRQLRAVLE
jgi:sulfate permease, SulP family